MRSNVASAAVSSQASVDDRDSCTRSTSVALALELLRRCVADLGWTLDALHAHMRKDKSFISRVLNGEKPMSLEFIDALPDDVEALWHSRRAEHFGLLVVEPVDVETARRHLVSGLLGVLAPRLPERAGAPLKAALRRRP